MWYSLILSFLALLAIAQGRPDDSLVKTLNNKQLLTVMKNALDSGSERLSYEKCLIKPSESCIIKENNPWTKRFRRAGLLDGIPDIYCGHEALKNRGISDLVWPVKNGKVQSWDDLEKLWHHMYYTSLYIPPEATRLLCVVHPLTSSKDKMKMAEILFESFTIDSLYIGISPAMVLYASGKCTGVVWENGASCCNTTAVYEGFPLTYTVTSSPLTGDAMTATLIKMLDDLGYKFTTPSEIQIAEEIKASQCFVSPDYYEQIKNDFNQTQYTLPDGQKITIGDLKFRCPEIMFQPSIGEFNCPSIVDDMFTCINKVDLDQRDGMLDSIVLAGGSSLFSGLRERLVGELKARLPESATWRSPKRVRVRVEGVSAREHAAWTGGSLLASMDTLRGQWMTAYDYEDRGPDVVNQKFF